MSNTRPDPILKNPTRWALDGGGGDGGGGDDGGGGVDNDGGDDDGVGGLDGGVENDDGDDDEDHCQPDCLNRGSPEDCSNV